MSKARDLANAGTALTTVSATELGYLDGVTSAVQTQIDSKIGSASAINPTIVDAKGDIIAATAADTVSRLAVGANDTILMADSSTATGLKWGTVAAGGMTLLSTTSMSGTSVVLSSINQSYKRLMLVGVSINRAGTASTRFYPQDGTTDLDLRYMWNSGGNESNEYSTYAIWPDNNNGYIATDKPLNFVWTIDNYASTTEQKVFQMYGSYYRTSTGVMGYDIYGGIYSNNAINKITISSDQSFNAGTIYTYGVN